MRLWAIIISALLALPLWASEPISGVAQVIDGDTLDVGQTRVRLFGIDAPEMDQKCDHPTSGLWPCGRVVSQALHDWIDGKRVSCARTGTDRYGRAIATCAYRGEDIGGRLVDEGLAYAFKRYSNLYVDREKQALFAGKGLWTSVVVRPETHRAERRTPAQTPPKDCAIKGNVSRDGKRIYHLPGQRFYAQTRINTGNGERWFCTEREARQAGWRRARR